MFKKHLSRLSWPLLGLIVSLILAVMVGISRGNLEVIIFKFLVFCPALCLVHLSRKALFPYVDLGDIWDSRRKPQPFNVGSDFTLGIFAYYIGMTYILTAVL